MAVGVTFCGGGVCAVCVSLYGGGYVAVVLVSVGVRFVQVGMSLFTGLVCQIIDSPGMI